jgi:hypothetical protein
MARKDRLTVYLLEYCGKITMNGSTSEFNDCQIYYLNNRTKRVYREWSSLPGHLISTGQRSIAATEREYYASAKRMGKIFSELSTYVTKLGEL